MKFLLVVVVVGFVLWLMFGRRSGRGAPPPGAGDRPRITAPEGMVACRHCGVHLPSSEALPGPGDARYCSAAHRDAGPRG